jgi:hypothetical protein
LASAAGQETVGAFLEDQETESEVPKEKETVGAFLDANHSIQTVAVLSAQARTVRDLEHGPGFPA